MLKEISNINGNIIWTGEVEDSECKMYFRITIKDKELICESSKDMTLDSKLNTYTVWEPYELDVLFGYLCMLKEYKLMREILDIILATKKI
jgi:hypothetical protein